jgi:hypothetical protein
LVTIFSNAVAAETMSASKIGRLPSTVFHAALRQANGPSKSQTL